MRKTALKFFLVLMIDGLLLAGMFVYFGNPNISLAAATTRYVAPGALCGSMTPCYAQVQAAVDAASPGDEIRVAAGVYTGVSTVHGETQVVYLDKTLTIRGGFSASDWSFDPDANPTILDAQGQGRVLFITGEIAPVIDGLRLTDGTALSGGGVSIYTATVTLQHTQIYSNTAGQWGGGVYLENSPSIISDNLIYSNTTVGNGNGGGLALANSSAVLITNTISDNRAHRGGGIYLANYKSGSGALLDDNLIQDNTAFDYSYGGNTYDGAGGGIYIISGYTDTLQSNVISQNTARRGGGLNLSYSPAVLFKNTIRENYAPYHGGGLYIQGSQPAIYQNQILTNTADSWGGGMSLLTDFAIVKGNTFQGNTAGECGGGLYTQSASEFVGNIFLANTAVEQGGGIFIVEDIDALYQNTVLVGNHAAEGGGIYLWGAVSHFYHTTISANSSTDGRAVVIDKYPGLVDPLATQHVLAKVAFTNTILANQTTGIFATAANTLTVNGVLWYNTPTPIQAAGASLTRLNEFTGDPKFEPDGYHLKAGSSAIDRGSLPALDHDVDGQLRPMLVSYDLGADELMLTIQIDPLLGGSTVIRSPYISETFMLQVPPGAITDPVTMTLAPFSGNSMLGCSGVVNSLIGGIGSSIGGIGGLCGAGFTNLMMGIDITVTQNHQPVNNFIFNSPITLTMMYSNSLVSGINERLISLLTLNPWSQIWENGGCGDPLINLGLNRVDTPVCHLSRFVYVGRPSRVYLPLVARWAVSGR